MRLPKLLVFVLAVICFLLIVAPQLRADSTIDYVYTSGGTTLKWELPKNPTPNFSDLGGFTITDLSFTDNGNTMLGTLDFYRQGWGGGFDLWTGNYFFLANAFGPQLYTGPASGPTLLGGDFYLVDFGNGFCPSLGKLDATVAPVPEPSSVILLLAGVALVAFTILRKS